MGGKVGGGMVGGERRLTELCSDDASEARRDSAVSESSEKRDIASRLYRSLGGVRKSGRAPAGLICDPDERCFPASEDMDVRRVLSCEAWLSWADRDRGGRKASGGAGLFWRC